MIPTANTVAKTDSVHPTCDCPVSMTKMNDLPIHMPSVVTPRPTCGQIVAKASMKKLKYKIIAAVILGIGCIVGAIVVTYIGVIYWRTAPLEQQVFQIVLHDKNAPQQISLNIKVDPTEQLEYVTSPQENGNQVIIGLKDFKKGIEAFKEEGSSKCYIGKMMPDAKLQTYENGSIQEANVEDNETFVTLNQTIHPFVLKLAAGERIVEFCGMGDAIWMIPINEADTEATVTTEKTQNGRQKRWGCWYCGRGYYRTCWWDCTWWGWKKWCTKRCYY